MSKGIFQTEKENSRTKEPREKRWKVAKNSVKSKRARENENRKRRKDKTRRVHIGIRRPSGAGLE